MASVYQNQTDEVQKGINHFLIDNKFRRAQFTDLSAEGFSVTLANAKQASQLRDFVHQQYANWKVVNKDNRLYLKPLGSGKCGITQYDGATKLADYAQWN